MGFRVIRGLSEIPSDIPPAVATVGNFDGVHAGHRSILRRVVQLSRERSCTPAVVTFDPHPTRVVAPARAPRLLTTIEQRCELMRRSGIELALVIDFTPEIAQLTPEQFVSRVLVEGLKARAVLVGENFRFGARQAGDVHTLEELGSRYGFEVEIIEGVRRHGRMVSSSDIRRLISDGDMTLAWRELERPYAVEGEIVPGRGIGSKQTVPTLNLATAAEVLPAQGVYITCTEDLESGRRWDSITNIGRRPTFGGESLTIETFLLSALEGDAPRRIRLSFLRRVRDERKFDSPAALKAQILADVARANAWFRRLRRWSGLARKA
ncbi:MAG TPA: bifunctional riboflavin kinase/FAD synthetase [Bryobacteraceae bacterium]|jgi:riboflavin kinase/FMN adenylyltransferase|nr:bifunctional riboflavin kinase/FAD synthetase [Bryobacteraceae bacterium]